MSAISARELHGYTAEMQIVRELARLGPDKTALAAELCDTLSSL
jgi:hypothetical protein